MATTVRLIRGELVPVVILAESGAQLLTESGDAISDGTATQGGLSTAVRSVGGLSTSVRSLGWSA